MLRIDAAEQRLRREGGETHIIHMLRAITGFYEDVEGHFVAMLECGHEQHVRHRPPFIERPWVLTAQGRAAKIGTMIECRACDAEGPLRDIE